MRENTNKRCGEKLVEEAEEMAILRANGKEVERIMMIYAPIARSSVYGRMKAVSFPEIKEDWRKNFLTAKAAEELAALYEKDPLKGKETLERLRKAPLYFKEKLSETDAIKIIKTPPPPPPCSEPPPWKDSPQASEADRHVNSLEALGPKLLDRHETARYLSIGLRTLDELLAKGEIPVIRFGASVRIRPAAIEAFLNARESRMSAKRHAEIHGKKRR